MEDQPRSRRAILGGGVGVLIGLVAAALGRPQIASAGSDGDVVLGAAQGSATTTQIASSTLTAFTGPVFRADATLANATAGVVGSIGPGSSSLQPGTPGGVVGFSPINSPTNAPGVVGEGLMTVGVKGSSGSSTGIFGTSQSGTAPGIFGWSSGNQTGVFGYSGTGIPGGSPYNGGAWATSGPATTGVMGYTDVPATTATGTRGEATQGVGVHGHSGTGVGVLATAVSGTALQVTGKIQLSRSGRVGIGSGKSSLVVTLAGVAAGSYVIATLQSNRPGVYVQAVVPATGKFTIYLNKAVTTFTYVGYIVIN